MSVCLVTLALSFSVYTTDSHYTVHVVYDILLSLCVCGFCVFYFEVHMSLWSGCSFEKIN